MIAPDQTHEQFRTAAWLTRHRGLVEFALVGICLLVYFLIRGNVVNRPVAAFSHAEDLIRLEQRLGFFWEPGWQHAITSNLLQIRLWNDVYFWAHAPVIVIVALWLYFRRRPLYRLIRNAFLVSALLGLFMYAIYPVAPPRLMTVAGYREYGVQPPATDYQFEDTMREFSNVSYQAESLKPFVNPFAAMPSLHFGWAFLIGLGVALALRNWLGALVAIVLPALMLFGIVLTANHFVIDAVAGLAVVLVGMAAALGYEQVPQHLRQRLVPRFLAGSPPPRLRTEQE